MKHYARLLLLSLSLLFPSPCVADELIHEKPAQVLQQMAEPDFLGEVYDTCVTMVVIDGLLVTPDYAAAKNPRGRLYLLEQYKIAYLYFEQLTRIGHGSNATWWVYAVNQAIATRMPTYCVVPFASKITLPRPTGEPPQVLEISPR